MRHLVMARAEASSAVTHENRRFTTKLPGVMPPGHLALTADFLDGFELSFKNDKEAWLLAFPDEPLAGLDRDVGGAARKTA